MIDGDSEYFENKKHREQRRQSRREERKNSDGHPNRLSSRTSKVTGPPEDTEPSEDTDGIIWSRVIVSMIIAVPIIAVVLNHYPTDILVAGLLVCLGIGVLGALIEE